MERALAHHALILSPQRGHLVLLIWLSHAHVAPAVAHALERLTIAAVARLQGPVVIAVEFHSGLQKEAGPQSPTARLWSGVSRRQRRAQPACPRQRQTAPPPSYPDDAASSGYAPP